MQTKESVDFLVRVDPSLKKTMKIAAAEMNITLKELVERSVVRFIEAELSDRKSA